MNKNIRIALSCSILAFAQAVVAGPGQLDATFGDGGRLSTSMNLLAPLDARVGTAAGDRTFAFGTVPNLRPAFVEGMGFQMVPGDKQLAFAGFVQQYRDTMGHYGMAYFADPLAPGEVCEPLAMTLGPGFQYSGTGWIYGMCASSTRMAVVKANSYDSGWPHLDHHLLVNLDAGMRPRALYAYQDGTDKLLVAGTIEDAATGRKSGYVQLFRADGSIETGFGMMGTGTVVVSGPFRDMEINAVTVDEASGRIVLAGATKEDGATQIDVLAIRLNGSGYPDGSFGIDGQRVYNLGADSTARSVLVDAGYIVVGGRTLSAGRKAFLMLRAYSTNGDLDSTFGSAGAATFGFGLAPGDSDAELDQIAYVHPQPSYSAVGRLTRDSDGQTYPVYASIQKSGALQASTTFVGPDPGAALARIDTYWSIERAAAGTDVRVRFLNLETSSYTYRMQAYIGSSRGAVVVQPDGRIVVLLSYLGESEVTRYLPTGAVDPSFSIGTLPALEEAMMFLQADGRIVAIGTGMSGLEGFRLNPDGSRDTSFAFQQPADGSLFPYFVARQADGKYLATMRSWTSLAAWIARFNADGTLDTSFDGEGLLPLQETAGSETYTSGVAPLADGGIVVARNRRLIAAPYTYTPVLERYLANGQPDTTFGVNGVAFADANHTGFGRSILPMSDGKVLVAAGCGTGNRACFVRFGANGAIDRTFAQNGSTAFSLPAAIYEPTIGAAVIDNGGRILFGGRYREWVARMTPDGVLDPSFNGTGATVDFFGPFVPNYYDGHTEQIVVQPDGNILVHGQRGDAWYVARLDGSAPTDTTDPETTLSAAPSSPNSSRAASFTFNSNEAGTFECRLDEAAFATCVSPVNLSNLADGSHTFAVRAKDLAGNYDPTPASATWTVDATPPETTITSAPSGTVGTNSAAVTFTSNEPLAGFECRLDGGAWTACMSGNPLTALADGAHTFDVRAKDAAGNVDGTPASATWTVDTTAPDTTIAGGPTGWVKVATATITFSANDAGASFECRLDGAAWAACTSPADLAGLAEGQHNYDVRSRDAVGNVDATPASRVWFVDTVLPDTTITGGPSGVTSSNDAIFTFTSNEPGGTFECVWNQVTVTPCTGTVFLGSIAEGAHTFTVKAIDRAGNVDPTPAVRSWTVDRTAPQTTITGAPGSPWATRNGTFTFAASEGSTFGCRLDGGSWTACSSPLALAGLADGPHSFEVSATDAAGNVDATPAVSGFVVDASPPESTITGAPAAITNQTSATFVFAANRPGTAFLCKLDAQAATPCSSPKTYSGLAEGAHTFTVTATDAVRGNEPTPSAYAWTVDTTAPNSTITDGPSGGNNPNTATLTFTSTEAGSTFQCKLDSGSYAACASPVTYANLAKGSHTFSVVATDPAGNTDPTPATRSWQSK